MGKVARLKKKKRDRRLLLANLAQVLNACDEAGLDIRLIYGSVYSNSGYILPIGQKRRWQVRIPLAYTKKK